MREVAETAAAVVGVEGVAEKAVMAISTTGGEGSVVFKIPERKEREGGGKKPGDSLTSAFARVNWLVALVNIYQQIRDIRA